MELATRSDANLALARQALGWFMDRDMDSFVAALDEHVEARPMIGGAPVLRGREAVQAWWSRLTGDIEVRPLDFEPHGDCVIVRGYLRRHDGRALAESQVYWLHEVHDGRITRLESHPTRQSALASV
jgi:ketosteroid isomerase-like protein